MRGDKLALQQAINAHQGGDLETAEAIYRQILQRDTTQVQAMNLLGMLLTQKGALKEAQDWLRQAIAYRPDMAMLHHSLGNNLSASGDLEGAKTHYQKALQLKPDYIEARINLGQVFERLSPSQAIECYQQALKIQPQQADLLNKLGMLWQSEGYWQKATEIFKQAVDLQPENPEFLFNLGGLLLRLGQFEASLSFFQKVLKIAPRPVVYNQLASVYIGLENLDMACQYIEQCLTLAPDHEGAYFNMGKVHYYQKEPQAAIESLKKAIQLSPDFADAHFVLGLILLQMGHYQEGWKEYQWRWKLPINKTRGLTQPRWNGDILNGKRILLYSEQGLGDAIQFIRYVPMVAQKGGKVLLECQSELVPLFQKMPEIAQIISRGEPLPPFDTQSSLLELPEIFGTTPETIPVWEFELLKLPNSPTPPHIGLVWSGNRENESDRRRSLHLDDLKPLFSLPDIEWFSLQKELTAIEQEKLQAWKVTNLSEQLTDFGTTAAIVQTLDLVITVDTSVAHLVGTLGKPVWILLSFVPDWRWGLEGESSPWYPSARLFRQHKPGDWEGVIQTASKLLQDRFAVN